MNRHPVRTAFGILVLIASAAAACRAGNVVVGQFDIVVDNAATDPSHSNFVPGAGQVTLVDSQLVNPWGISFNGGSPFWVSDNGTGVATLYTVAGVKNPTIAPAIPIGSATPAGTLGTPTGQVASSAFTIPGGVGASAFIFATEDGTISAWNGTLVAGNKPAIIVADNSASAAVYKGLAATTVNGSSFLLAANFRSGKIDLFDHNFAPVNSIPGGGTFTDPSLPLGYAPFNVAVLGNKVFVSYAVQSPDKHDDVAALGNGIVDSFNLDGTNFQRLVANTSTTNPALGTLDSPWGLAIAPGSFGSLAGDLLVGNFGNGWINAFNPTTGLFDGFLTNTANAPLVIRGLWAITPGNTGSNGSPNILYFTAGPQRETAGVFGELATVPEPSSIVLGVLGAVLVLGRWRWKARQARLETAA